MSETRDARPGGRDPGLEGLARDLEQPGRGLVDPADRDRPGRVAEVAVDDGAAVDPDDVAFLERALAGDPVDDLVVDRRAEGLRIAPVAR